VAVTIDLLAEVDRLRKELDYLSNRRRLDNGDLARAYDEGRDRERAAVVAWLREQDATIDFRPRVWPMAEMIERGEHRREEER